MAPPLDSPEIIDLTQPDVVELDSDGEVVGGLRSDVKNVKSIAPDTNGPDLSDHAKKKRRKRKRKSSGTTSAAVSRAQSPDATGSNVLEDDGGNDHAAGKKDSTGTQDRRRDRPDRDRDRDGSRDRRGDRQRERERRRSRSPRREHGQDRNHEHSRRRSHSRERERERNRRTRGKDTEVNELPFYEDVTPAEVVGRSNRADPIAGSTMPSLQTSPEAGSASSSSQLLLPVHVSIAEEAEDVDVGSLDIRAPEGSDEDDDYIDYLDYDDDRRDPGMVRYWELEKIEADEARASKPTRFVCKKCGAEGEHKTFECPVLICLTCGARDEHGTRSCPISKVCFTCGMKGHINRTCPNRGQHGVYHSAHDCDRCGARTHQTNECPTLWRLYKYVEDHVRQEILRVREQKRVLGFGEGGEGYIATDEWCYNCGECGHLGDDCTLLNHDTERPIEHSAFSLYNILSGPFSSEASRPVKRTPREWETASAFADGYGATVPMDVGKQGKRKQRDRLERRQHELDSREDEQDDWFGTQHSRTLSGRDNRGPNRHGGDSKANGNGGGGKIKIQFSSTSLGGRGGGGGGRDGKRQRTRYDDLPGPSRENDSIHIRGAARNQSRGPAPSRDRYHNRYDMDRERDRDSQRGPRYRGGYSR